MAFIPALAAGIGSAVSGITSAFGGVGSFLSAAGTVASGVSALAAGNYQKQVADMNASIAKQNAARAEERGQIVQQETDNRTAAFIGQQEAAQSASGISLGSRSAIATRRTARQLGRLDALNVRQGADVEAYNYQVDAVNQKAQGQMAQNAGVGTLIGSFFKAGGSLVGGSNSVANSAAVTGGGTYTPLAQRKTDPWAGMRSVTI